jgi:hypothetical protein
MRAKNVEIVCKSCRGKGIASRLFRETRMYRLCPNLGKASTLATPYNDPIAKSIDEYQAFLKTLGYSLRAKAAYGKKIQ